MQRMTMSRRGEGPSKTPRVGGHIVAVFGGVSGDGQGTLTTPSVNSRPRQRWAAKALTARSSELDDLNPWARPSDWENPDVKINRTCGKVSDILKGA